MTGKGIIKGMAVTARNFLGSYCRKDRLTTIQYPEEKPPPEQNYRNFPFLVYDGGDPEAGLRCTACKICEKACPPQCIYIVMQRDENGKPRKHPRGLRPRHLRLHELPDLRRSLPLRLHQNGQGL